MVKYRRQGIGVSFTDVIFNLLLGVTLMFFLALILINPITENKKVDAKAEFIVTLNWPDHHNSDIDLWTLDPHGIPVGYASKEGGVSSLERDDTGSQTDTHYDQVTDVTTYVKENYEIITIRGIVSGAWTVNVHYYASRPIPDGHISGMETPPYPDIKRIPTTVEVSVIKLNPIYEIIAKKKILLTFEGEERTIARFKVNKEGDVTNVTSDEQFRFVTKRSNVYNGY